MITKRDKPALRPILWCSGLAALCVAVLLGFCPRSLKADQVEMQNGDRYIGNVVTMTMEKLTLHSEVLGTVTLPRAKVARISLGETAQIGTAPVAATTNAPTAHPNAASAQLAVRPSSKLPQISTNAAAMEQAQEKLLADATPEARAKFRDMALGYLTGKLSVDDIRAEARTAVEQLKSLKSQQGDAADSSFDTYLEILENFLNEGQPAKSPAPATKTNPAPHP